MNILIIGNGFDLAHGLPTRYSDFLEFCKKVKLIWSYGLDCINQQKDFRQKYLDDWNTAGNIRSAIQEAFNNRIIEKNKVYSDNAELSEIYELLNANVWYDYFLKLYNGNLIKGENWIDFESEIKEVIQNVDQNSRALIDSCEGILKSIPSDDKFNCFKKVLDEDSKNLVSIRDFRQKTYNDLERITRVLELYLSSFVNHIKIEGDKKIPEINEKLPIHVLDFNYTNTFERIYKRGGSFSYPWEGKFYASTRRK